MSKEEEDKTNIEKEESMGDYASKRLVELKNSERRYVNAVPQAQAVLDKAQADLIACRARIDEMRMIIQKNSPPPKKP
jgi:hypothetical protein